GQAALQHDTVKPKEILDVAPEIDPRLAKAIMQCIESDPQKRPESPEQFARLLHSVSTAFPA
ncbi:MAG: serine/threonine protein kinase, partial [Planctomycetota bacterium]|nr:serine/threonine protein kinase [Planctomycetota bacterium]